MALDLIAADHARDLVARAAELRLCGPDDPRWLEFAGAQPEATVFHHPAWSRVMVEAYGYRSSILLQLDRSGAVSASLPLLEVQRWRRRRRVIALPFTDYCPPLAQSEDALAELTAALVGWQRRNRVEQFVVRGDLAESASVQPVPRAVRHLLSLSCSSQEFLARIKGTQVHRAIKKAEREGVTARLSRSAADCETFYRLHLQTRRRQGVPVQPRRFMRLLHKHVIEPGLGFVVLAYKDGQPIAGAIYLAWNRNLIYKFGASDPRFWELRPNNLVMWTAIQWACEHGYRQLDFGRSDLENAGLREFKRRWGALELPLTYSYLTAVPAQPGRRLAARVMASVIRHSPSVVCRLTGELLYGFAPGLAA